MGRGKTMSRVFIQVYCNYPHGEASSNYIQNLAKAILAAGYEVILATDINEDYEVSDIISSNKPITVIPVVPSRDEKESQQQKKKGFYDERIGILKEYGITKDDRVIILWLKNEFFLNQLFAFEKEVGFKSICGVLELFAEEDYPTKDKFVQDVHIVREVYLQSDAILSISEYIDQYYINRGKKVYRLPPMIDVAEYPMETKSMDKYKFIIPSQKDSLRAMIMAFMGMEQDEIENIELHLCGTDKETLKKMFSEAEWRQLMKFSTVHGWLKYEKLIDLYQRMHFMVIARNTCQRTLANFPSKVPEVMNLGVIPIVSDVGDYTKYYLKDDYDSFFVNGDSVEEIRKSIRKAISLNKEEYRLHSENARRTAKERFDYHVWIPKVKQMLETV